MRLKVLSCSYVQYTISCMKCDFFILLRLCYNKQVWLYSVHRVVEAVRQAGEAVHGVQGAGDAIQQAGMAAKRAGDVGQ
jgi:hypothetical protein